MKAAIYRWFHQLYHLFEAAASHVGHGHTPWGL